MTLMIDRAAKAQSAYEYGCDLRRIYPWDKVGSAAGLGESYSKG